MKKRQLKKIMFMRNEEVEVRGLMKKDKNWNMVGIVIMDKENK